MEKADYDVISTDQSCFSLGLDFLREGMDTTSVPFVSLNLVDKKTGKFSDQPFVLKDTGKFRVAIVGLTGPLASEASRARASSPDHTDAVSERLEASFGESLEEYITILEPIKSLKTHLPFIRSQSDLIVLVSSLNQSQNEEIADRFPEIDVILGKHSEAKEIRKGSTLIINNKSSEGKNIGSLILAMNDDGQVSEHEIEWLPVKKTYAEDRDIRKILNDFYDAVAHDKTLWREAEPRLASFKLEKDQTNEYVGASQCMPCHKEIYKEWKRTDHADAYNTLVKKNRYFYPDCISCHTTGAGFPDGFKIDQTTKHLEGVQCEVCHGPGSRHLSTKGTFQLRAAATAVCRECHTDDVSPDFREHFEELLAMVDHSEVPENLRTNEEIGSRTKPKQFPNLSKLKSENPELFNHLYEGLSSGCRKDHLLFECKGKSGLEMKGHLDQLLETDRSFESLTAKMVEKYGDKVKSTEQQKALFKLKQQSVVDTLRNAIDKEGKASLDLFVMSYCPYAVRAVNLLYELEEEMFKDKLELRLHFIASEIKQSVSAAVDKNKRAPRRFKALHGQKEVDENIRQVLIQEYYPEKLKQYLLLRNKSIDTTDWMRCAEEAGIDTDEILRRIGTGEGIELFAENIELAKSRKITASPTMLINGQRFRGRFRR